MPIKGIITKGSVPVKIWESLENIESGAIEQLTNCSRLPFVFKHVAVMPDVHYGLGATIGSVIPTKGAVCPAAVGVDLGCGMGARSFIVRGLGSADSFMSCSHGAGRRMSRGAAKKMFTTKDLETQTAGVECRKDDGVIDEIPQAYKDIGQVMENQSDLVSVVAELKQVLCVKG